jgi:CzcA family heavy metal efflux pump
MRRIVGLSLRAPLVVAVAAVAIILAGIWQFRSARIDSLPEFMPTTVQVQTEALGLSAPEVEQLITVPLEQDLLAGVPWLDTMRSESIPGLSSIELVFDSGTDLLQARQVVQERLTQAAGLPNVSSTPQMLQPLASTSRIMMIRLSSTTVSPIEMSVLARWTIRPKLLGVRGVANVSIWGQRERQLQVQVDPKRLSNHGLSLQDMIETSGNALWASPLTFLEASTPGTGGFFDTSNQRLSIQHLQPITTAKELAQVPIDGAGAKGLRLGDVAEVVEDHQPLIGDTVFTDGDPGLLLVVDKFPGTNTVEVTRDVESALDALRPGLSGIHVNAGLYRPATYIEKGIGNLERAGVIGFLLLIVGLGALLFSWRSALIGLVSILASLAAAWLMLDLRGDPINTMMLAGLALALAVVIEDALGDGENIAQRLRQRRMNGAEPPPRMKTVLEASLEIRGPIAYATVIALVAVVPLFFLQGTIAPFVPSIVLSYALAIVASMLVALIVTPALCLLLLADAPLKHRESPVARWLKGAYDRTLSKAIKAPRRAYAGAAIVLLAGLLAIPLLDQSALPSFRDGDVLIDLKAAPGTSLPEMDRITGRLGAELSSLPGVIEIGVHVGRAITSDQVVGVDSAQLWVSLDPAADYDATVASLQRVAAGYPGIDETVRTYSDERIGNVHTGSDRPIVVRLYGQDPDTLQSKAGEVVRAMSDVDGIVHPSVELQPVEPTLDVAVDLDKADRYGIVPGDVRRSAATLISGIGVGSLFEQQKVFDVVVWGTPDVRNSLTSVSDMLIDTPGGGSVPLGKVADVTIQSTPTVLRHQGGARSLDVTADVQGRDPAAVAEDVDERIQDISFPLEYHAEMVGDFTSRQAAHLRAIMVAFAAAIGIFLLLQAAFGSWRLASISFFALPLGLMGGLFGVLITGRLVSLGSIVGFLAVFAITVRGIVQLIRHYQYLERDEGVAFGAALVRRGSRERLIPIVATVVVAGLVLLPLALSGAAAGEEIVQPMAVVILGGLVTSTLLSLFVVPNLYLTFGSATPPAPTPTPTDIISLPDVDQVGS